MTMANGLTTRKAQHGDGFGPGPSIDPVKYGVVTMAGTLTLDSTYRNMLKLNPDGAVRELRLPVAQAGLWFKLIHGGAANFTITVKTNDGVTTIETIEQNTEIDVWCSDEANPTWTFICKRTIALT